MDSPGSVYAAPRNKEKIDIGELKPNRYYGYEYDTMGRVIRKSASGRTLLAYSYDLNGNLTSQRDVTGKQN